MTRKSIKVKWIEDALTEHDLALSGLAFAFNPAVQYSDIDIHGGLHNRAREHTALMEEVWMDYAMKMEAGNPFKGVVLYQVNDGVFKYGVAHGNHRLRAFACLHNDDTKFLRSGNTLVGAYIIGSGYTDDVEEFERFANCREGPRQSREYAMLNAMWLTKNRSASLKLAAERTGLSASQIGERIRANETRAEIESLGVDTTSLSPSHLSRLGSLKHDSHKKHVATMIADGNISTEDTSKLIAKVNHLRTEAKGNAFIYDEINRTRRERVGPRHGEIPVAQKKRKAFLKGFRAFEDLWLGPNGRPISTLKDVGIEPQDVQVRQELASRARDIIKVLENVLRLKK